MPEPIGSANSSKTGSAPDERRASERYPREGSATWLTVSEEKSGLPWAAVRDISLSGIGLIVKQPLQAGSVLVITLHNHDLRLARMVPIRVMHATPTAGGDWILGCQFVRKLT